MQVDLENGIVHIADSKTVNGIGNMPMTTAAREAFQRQIAKLNRKAERAAGEFVHGAAQLTDFIHIFRTVGASRQCGEGGRCCSERTSLRYFGRAAGI